MSEAEHEVRDALFAYKHALVKTNYRNAWHRLCCWAGDRQAAEAERVLQVTIEQAKAVANRSAEHRAAVRLVASQQPAEVRELDCYEALLVN